MAKKICGNCSHWEAVESEREGKAQAGECHEGPPIGAEPTAKYRWPCSYAHETCGKHKKSKG